MKKLSALALLWLVPLVSMAMPGIEFSAERETFNKRVVLFIDSTETLTGSAQTVNQRTDGALLNAMQAAEVSTAFGKTQSFYGVGPTRKLR